MVLRIKPINSIKLYLFISFFTHFLYSFVFTVNSLYQITVAKLNPFQLVLMGTILEISILLFEIPTGIVADKKSRKLSLLLGFFLIGTGFIIEGSFPLFWIIAAAQVIWGIGYTFTSGALQAWITDEIGVEKTSKVFIRGSKFSHLGDFAAIPLSIVIGSLKVFYPIIVGGILFFLLTLFLFLFMEEKGFVPHNVAEKKEKKTGSHWLLLFF